MAWDAKKHVVKAKKAVTVSETTKIIIERYSYDGAEERVGLKLKITKKNGDSIYAPFKGGYSPEIMLKVAKHMKKLSSGGE